MLTILKPTKKKQTLQYSISNHQTVAEKSCKQYVSYKIGFIFSSTTDGFIVDYIKITKQGLPGSKPKAYICLTWICLVVLIPSMSVPL